MLYTKTGPDSPAMVGSGDAEPPRSGLEWLLSPITSKDFFGSYWEQRPLVVQRAQSDYFSNLLSLQEVDRVVTTLGRRYPDVQLKNARNADLNYPDYTLDGDIIDVPKLYELFDQGSTITLAFLDTVIPALTVFCRTLENEFCCPCQTNAYLTPPDAQGAKPHYDTHDVFVLQVSGSKRWTIFGTPVESPLPGQAFDAQVHDIGAPTLEFELKAGDVAYIPRGVAHEARSSGTLSLHITTGLLRYTWTDLLLEFIASASLSNAALRKALPPGFATSEFDRSHAHSVVKELLKEVSLSISIDPVLDSFAERLVSRCPPVLAGQMAQLAALDTLTIESVVGARQGIVFYLRTKGDSISINTCGREITFPSYAEEPVRFALHRRCFVVEELPGQLDSPGKLTLVRRLIREGLLYMLNGSSTAAT